MIYENDFNVKFHEIYENYETIGFHLKFMSPFVKVSRPMRSWITVSFQRRQIFILGI